MARELGTGTILINGGGNLGDLWPNHQLFRERILQDFPDNPVLQLPQSMFFGERSALKRFQDICTRHPNFHILLRDRTSLNLATELLDVPVSLCPDMAFGLGPLSRPADPHTDIFWLSRTDKESLGRQPLDRVERQDWLEQCSADDIGDWAAAKCKRDLIEHILGALCNRPRDSAQLLDEVANAYESLAWIGVNRGLRMLAQGRVIITDRLHGHILGLCLNIPQIVMDNSYHKISSFIETWTQQSPITHWANSPEHALMQARELLGHTT